MSRPWCHNRAPRVGQWVRAGYKRGKVLLRWLPHVMSQECRAWATGDRATPAPALDGWQCQGCRWFPAEAEQWSAK
jgi:hypothetical protein